ncbi:HAMP domain-containing sensor histidine kinase [Lentzea sp. CC55]|uniref:HAMP domain-containing sensor histidine kinase n=1 Tax=Lentzea sp. CC55 TaxID=2884909 RepID=UPI0027E1591A|nr:HAMP domain-containing sensor histidine kinase [Lentzea sp. CC55]MCG8928150.1 HAMP domain-containing histidine kinase [Lentzea sp. CC55]
MRRSLVLVALAATSMVALAFLIPLAIVVKSSAYNRALNEAEKQANALTPALLITRKPQEIRQAIRSTRYGGQQRLAVHLSAPAGTYGTSHITADDLEEAQKLATASTVERPDGVAYLQPLATSSNGLAIVEAFVPHEQLTRGVVGTWWVLAGVAAGLVAGSVLVADRLGARAVKATRALAEGARRMGQGDLSARVPVKGPPEVAEAGKAFNAMAERVRLLLAAEREVVADLSHRLRTPLTALLLDADTLGRGPGADRVREAVQGLEREVDEIIRAARSGLRADDGGTDASAVVRERLVFWSALADDQERPWTVRGTDRPAPVPLGRNDLAAALDALLGNVFRYTPEGTRFAVALVHQADLVALVVEDAGPGIADTERAVRRGASGGGSTGLGLDIARRAAERTGGSLHVDRGPLGGARVQLRLRRM